MAEHQVVVVMTAPDRIVAERARDRRNGLLLAVSLSALFWLGVFIAVRGWVG